VGLHSNARDPFKLGFLQPAVPALKTQPCLIVPGGWFQPQRIVELKVGEKIMQARLTKLVTRGSNFDQVEFTTVGRS